VIPFLSRLRVAFSLSGLFVVVYALMENDNRMMWVAIALLGGSVIERLLLRRAVRDANARAEQEHG
jgi:hypothetical protein